MADGQTPKARVVSFGSFEFDPQTGELRKHGMRVKLQGQPVEALTMLLERPGEVVTREEMQKRLWSGDTYVDFEHSLNAAMKRLRAALGDSADSPRFVETLARRGYRFIAPLKQPPMEVPGDRVAIQEPAAAPAARKPAQGRRFAWTVAAIAAVIPLIVTGRFLISAHAPSEPIHSLAVLPLANLSGDPEQDYFSEGMTDALRQNLESISSLRVISRASSMHYRKSGKPLPDIARELDIDAVVDGSVLRSGNRVRINVELSQASQDKRLWSNSYDGDLQDVLALQANVARTIADEIRVKLTSSDRARLARVHTTSAEAYLAYSKGRFYSNKRSPEGLQQAIGFFQRAIDKDPDYALAYDGMADSWVPLGWYGYLAPAATFPNAKASVIKALNIDDSLAEAHTTLAFVKLYYDRDWAGADREFRRGIELNPNYANGHHWYAEYLSLAGRHRQAIAESERAREIEPGSTIINAWVSSRYFYSRQYDKAVAEGRNAVEMDPDFAPAHFVLGQVYEQKGMLQEAIAEFAKAYRPGSGSSIYGGSLAHALGIAGRRGAAKKVLDQLEGMAKSQFVSSYDTALGRLGLGDQSKALDLLQAAVEERSPRAAFIGIDPRFDTIRTDRRFRELLTRLGVPGDADR